MAAKKCLRIKKFPIHLMKNDRTILVLGKRGSGKTTLVKDIVFNLRKKLDTGFVITPTIDTQIEFEDCFPKSHIYDEYNIETVRNIVDSAESLKAQNIERHILLIVDDCMYDNSVMKTVEMRKIHMNGRHFNITLINSVQYLMDIGPAIRGQIDYVFCLKEGTKSTREKLYKYFFGIFQKFSEFEMAMDKCTENHGVLVLDNTATSNNIADCIFYYRANNKISKFRVGRSIYYKLDYMFRKNNQGQVKHNRAASTKLPEPMKTKDRIEQIQKDDND